MPRDGAGTMIRETPVATGTTAWLDTKNAGNINITTGDHDFHDQDLAFALTTSIATDGQSVISADIPWNGHKITGLANGSAATDAAAFGQVSALSQVLISTQTVTSPVSSVDFTGIGTTYNTYIVEISGLTSSNTTANVGVRYQQNAAWATTAYYSTLINYDSAGGTIIQNVANGSFIILQGFALNTTGWSGSVRLLYPQGAGLGSPTPGELTISGGSYDPSITKHYICVGGGTRSTTGFPITGLRFFLNASGNITAGIFSLYGLKS